MDKRYFIFKLDGKEVAVIQNPENARILYNMIMDSGNAENTKTELNTMTTTYYFKSLLK